MCPTVVSTAALPGLSETGQLCKGVNRGQTIRQR